MTEFEAREAVSEMESQLYASAILFSTAEDEATEMLSLCDRRNLTDRERQALMLGARAVLKKNLAGLQRLYRALEPFWPD